MILIVGGQGSPSGGEDGGGGMVHFHWSNILLGDECITFASVKGNIITRGGYGGGLPCPPTIDIMENSPSVNVSTNKRTVPPEPPLGPICLTSYHLAFLRLLQRILHQISANHSKSNLTMSGSLRSDGESFGEGIRSQNGRTSIIVPGGGSSGTVLVFVRTLVLGDQSSMILIVGGQGSPSGGEDGGGGRVHFHWSNILLGDECITLASVKGNIITRGGLWWRSGSSWKKWIY
ncbi:hypothetical protein TSUD_71630 [Trifolium subterraneum]|uniref:Uncharacterized protein n=1 Tax=Trifolium subterraneum TaxID=3900 RepID=A0A2Z6N9I6_TRISU|nr:hypothetical protein TSUD_71630 [Trifolium subterraneum]